MPNPRPALERPTVSLAVARELVLAQMRHLGSHTVDPRDVAPIMLWGPPGIGKSELLRALCAEHGFRFVDVRLAQRDPVDLRGLPVPDGEVVRWLPSSEWPRDPGSRGILLFDELSAADRTLQVAAYELILDRRLGDTYQIPAGWMVCGAGNRGEDASVSLPMSAALANRFLHLDLEVDLDAWVAWAERARVRPEVIAFLRYRPSLLLDMGGDLQRGWPSPRSWARVSSFLDAAGPLSTDARRAALAGLVGPGPAIELEAFLHAIRALPDLAAVLRGEVALATLPDRPDALYALATGLARHVWSAPDRPRALGILLHLGAQLEADFATMLVTDAMRCAPAGDGHQLMAHPALERFRARHGAVFRDEPTPAQALPAPGWESDRRRRRSAR
jgi:hypothetical protein